MIAIKTLILIAAFSIAYLSLLIRKTARHQLDIYDLLILSTVAIFPFTLAAAPELALWLTHITGVEFPFVVMFGMLFAILFLFIHRLTIKIHQLEQDVRRIIQEASLLKQCIEDNQSSMTKDQ